MLLGFSLSLCCFLVGLRLVGLGVQWLCLSGMVVLIIGGCCPRVAMAICVICVLIPLPSVICLPELSIVFRALCLPWLIALLCLGCCGFLCGVPKYHLIDMSALTGRWSLSKFMSRFGVTFAKRFLHLLFVRMKSICEYFSASHGGR